VGQIRRQVLDAVVAEVAVQLAVERKLFVVESLNGGRRALQVKSRQ
jgi:hypothetical protein